MDKYVMDIRLQNWIPIFEAQARSGLDKQTFCKQNGISRGLFFKWQRILRERIADGFDPGSISASTTTNVSECMMHLRRYFALSLFVHDLNKMTEEEILHLPEISVLMIIRAIYHEEKKLKNMTADDRLAARKEFVAPKVKELFDCIHELDASEDPHSEKLSKAISYAINQETYLRRFLEDGNIPIDNGSSERYISTYSKGRANWLFADTVLGAEVNAAMYSIVETAKANKVNPYEYIKYLLEKMPEHLDEKGNVNDPGCLDDMMPWSDAFHDYEIECSENRNRIYSGMFPIPLVPKPPKKMASIARDTSEQDSA